MRFINSFVHYVLYFIVRTLLFYTDRTLLLKTICSTGSTTSMQWFVPTAIDGLSLFIDNVAEPQRTAYCE